MYKILSTACILLMMVMVVLLGGCPGKQKTKEGLLRDGTQLLASGNPGGAIVLLKNALDKDQNYFEARLALSKAYVAAGKIDSAEKELQKLQRQRPDSREVRIEMAKIYLGKSKPDEALTELEGLNNETADAEVQEIVAWAYVQKEDYPTALGIFRRTLEANPGRTSTELLFSRAYYRMGNIEAAQKHAAAVLQQEPGNRGALLLSAELHLALRDTDSAIKIYDQLLTADPADVETRFRQGILYLEKGMSDEALKAARTIISQAPKRSEGHLLEGMAQLHKKAYGEAIIALQKSLALGTSAGAYYYLGLAHYNQNEFEQAIAQLQKALALRPSFTQSRALLAALFLKKNRADDAIRESKKALEGNEDDALAHNILGSAYVAKGMFGEGIAELNKAIALDPKLVDAHVKKGVIQIRRGKPGDAEMEFTAALRINPELLSSRLMLASYYLNQGVYDKAERIAREGIKGGKDDAALYNVVAESHLRRHQADEAAAAFLKAKEANPEDDYAYFKLASLYMAKGEYDKGIQELKSLVERVPGNIRALLTLASLHESRGKNADALAYYVRARETENPEGYIEEARYWIRNKDADRAVGILNDAIRRHSANASLYEWKGRVLLSQKRYREAVRTFEELKQIDPKLGFSTLVEAHLAAGEYDKALDLVNRQIRKEPDRAELKAEVSRIYLVMGKKREAVESAAEIVRSHPESAAGYQALAVSQVANGEADKAIATLKKAQVRDAGLSVMLGNLLAMQKQNAAALEEYRRAETITKGYVPAVFQKGAVLHGMGKKKEAVSEYQRVLRSSPNYVPALNNLAYLYAEDNRDLTLALQYAFRAFLLAPKDGAVNDTLGYVLLKRGRTDESLKVLKNAAALIPGSASVHYHLALAYEQSNEKALALESLQTAVSIGKFPEEASARTLIMKLKKEKGS